MAKMKPIFKRLSSYSLQGLYRVLLLRLTGKEYIVTGSCNYCGNCCRKINLKASTGWLRSEKQFNRMQITSPDFDRFKIVGRDSQGFLQFTCSWLLETGLCQDHENRLDICSGYPEKSLMFCGGMITEGCGYRIEKVTPFNKILSREKKRLL